MISNIIIILEIVSSATWEVPNELGPSFGLNILSQSSETFQWLQQKKESYEKGFRVTPIEAKTLSDI